MNRVNKSPNLLVTTGGQDIPAFTKSKDYLRHYTGWVYANVKRRSEQMANVDIKLMRQLSNGEVEEVVEHPALQLLDHVNTYMSRQELLEVTYAHMDLAGESFWMVDRGESATGEPQSIIPLVPYNMKVVPGTERLLEGYIYNPQGFMDGQEVPLKPEEVVFMREPNPNNPFRGMSAIAASALTIDNDDAQEEWSFNFFKHGATSDPVFETEHTIDEESLKKHYTELEKNFSGSRNARKPMILHGGMKLSTGHQLMQKDMEFLEGQKWTRDKIMSIIGTTKVILGVVEDVNRANAEASEYVFAKYMIAPRVRKLVGFLNEYYLPMFKGTEDLFFMPEDLVSANVAQETELFSKALAGASWMTPNEVRERKGLGAIEGGDVLLIPSQMRAIDEERIIPPNMVPEKFTSPTHRKAYLWAKDVKGKVEEADKKAQQAAYELAEKLLTTDMVDKGFRARALQKGGYIDQYKQFADTEEMKFKKAAQNYFHQQEQITLRELDRRFHNVKIWQTKSPASELLPDEDNTLQIGIRLFTPLLSGILQERGNEALFFIGSNIGFDLSNPKVQRYLENHGLELVKGINDTTRDSLRKTLSVGLDEGEGIPDLKKRIKDVFSVASDSRAEKIARTEVIDASNEASELAWKQSGVVASKEWLAVADDRTDEDCFALDGKVVSLSGKFGSDLPHPPLHPNCRCTLIPVLKDEKAINEFRAKQQDEEKVMEILTQKEMDKLNKRVKRLYELQGVK